MSLSTGTKIGAYEIVGALGIGGMGQVYRARDAKLNRDVAIKVLLPAVANEPDYLARFSREAQVLASLNHPNIGHIYGLEDAGNLRAIVMELVEGPTLEEMLRHTPSRGLPIDEALSIARQIAEALEAAHEQGIIHRDLKPANIKLKANGTVKVLDFGLAKAKDPAAASSAAATISPALPMHATQAGIILGTAAYMSPEQANGKPVDKRADIWAFGVVLYEMVTGRKPFGGDHVGDVLAAVIKDEPSWDGVPAQLRRLLQRCLE
jgi:serine/threonine protein kinase